MSKRGHNATPKALLLAAALLVSTVAYGQSEGVAKVEVLNGRVDLLRDSVPWVLSPGDSIKPGQLIVSGPDGYAIFRLADNSTFEVFPNSQVTFRDNRGDWRDLLDVWLGKIRVHIEKLSGGRPNTNRIHTPTAVISVKGTVFQVGVEQDGSTTVVVVEEGLVGVRHKLLPGKEVPVTAGESIRILKSEPLAVRQVDKGAMANTAARAAAEALYRLMLGRSRLPGSGGGSSPTSNPGGLPGDSAGGGTDNPPPTPPPPPPATPPPPPPAP